jgi:hypothetical protein
MHIHQLQPSGRSMSGIHHPTRSTNHEPVIQTAHLNAGPCKFQVYSRDAPHRFTEPQSQRQARAAVVRGGKGSRGLKRADCSMVFEIRG